MAVGNMSLVLCPMFTWSLGWIGLSACEAIAAEQLDGPVGDHLVGVHVARRARAGLKHVDRKLAVELPFGHFAARLPAAPRPASSLSWFLPVPGELAQIAIGHRRRPISPGPARESAAAAAASRRSESSRPPAASAHRSRPSPGRARRPSSPVQHEIQPSCANAPQSPTSKRL